MLPKEHIASVADNSSRKIANNSEIAASVTFMYTLTHTHITKVIASFTFIRGWEREAGERLNRFF